MKNIKTFTILTLLLLLGNACKKSNLVVENLNNPDFADVYASGTNVAGITGGLYTSLFNTNHSTGGVQMMLGVAADQISCSWGNFGMRDMSWEPRDNAWNNTAAYNYNTQTKGYFDGQYSPIVTASLIAKSVNAGTTFPTSTPGAKATLAFARFIMGVGHGNIALVFDRGFVVDENVGSDGKLSDAVPFTDLATAALKNLDEAIAISNANTFTIPAAWLSSDVSMSNVQFAKLCNTYAAAIMAYLPRNKTQLAAVNWAKVKTYADAGITTDFNVVMDDVKIGDNAAYYSGQGNDTWARTDMYVVNIMDPAQPAHWDDVASFPTPPKSTNPPDKRLLSDFQYLTSNTFQAARGYYHFSNYRNKRYDAIYIQDLWAGTKPEVMKAENDMLRAEARVYGTAPDLLGAAGIINAGTRVTRGQLPPVAATTAALVDAIHQERLVEMSSTGANLAFYEMRKLNLLQKGTPLNMPLPAKTLETIAAPAPFYTFGTTAKADGINTSNAGWR